MVLAHEGPLGLKPWSISTSALDVDASDPGELMQAWPPMAVLQLHSRAEVGSTIHSDEARVYADVDGLFFQHETINHSAHEYSRNGVTTNSVESVFAVLKRGRIHIPAQRR